MTLPQDEAQLGSVSIVLSEATNQLAKCGISAPRFNAECLLCYAMDVSRTALFSRLRDKLPDDQKAVFLDALLQRLQGKPLQYIIGSWDFYGRSFLVTPDVLIPRPETERLVELALDWIGKQSEPVTMVDVGTGSGAIAVTTALETGLSHIYAMDISEQALAMANRNAERLGARHIRFLQSDLCSALIEASERVSLCVANLPYIAMSDQETLDAEVVDYEPHLALFAGEDGLELYRRLIDQLPRVLANSGPRCFMAEVGLGQAPTVAKWLTQSGLFLQVRTAMDYNDIERFVIGEV